VPIESHNNIEELRTKENTAFQELKTLLILGTRKTHKYTPNFKVSDYLVPFTSSGCTAMCLYCYLVCNYNKCSYLRVFVNREQMMDRLIRYSNKSDTELTFEIGSNSDLILENTLTNNLPWIIDNFMSAQKGKITFPTKFNMVEPLLGLSHQGRVIFRMSVNPQFIISNIEVGTASLKNRISALNKMAEADYPVGILIAPVIMLDNWKELYTELLDTLKEDLTKKVKEQMFIEIIFMTYSFIHRSINSEAFPEAIELYDKDLMKGRGMGKYCYRPELRTEGEEWLLREIDIRFGKDKILYFS
jgi:spore photoproduct lyase